MSLRFTLQGTSGSRGGNNPGADTTSRRIKKILSKGLKSHRGWLVVNRIRPDLAAK